MTSWSAITKHPERATAEALAEALEAIKPAPLGIACLEIEDGSGWFEVAGYFDHDPDEIALMLLCAVHGVDRFIISKIDDRDWVAQVRRELTPVRAGRFLVYGRHDRDQLGPSDIGLEIEAAMAFGTGHHGTTLGCLELTEHLYNQGFCPETIADIGTGTGILAMAAKRRWPLSHIFASDIESIAVATASANFAINKARDIHAIEARGFCHPLLRQNAPYDLIYANILARPLRALAPEMARNLNRGGHLILSGILRRQGASVLSNYRPFQFKMIEKREIGEWVSFLLRKL